MSSSALGLIELVLVFGLLLGFGLWQLYATRRDQRRADEQARREAERRTPPRQ
jgi:cytochrome oxidase assembly protein ShyY1